MYLIFFFSEKVLYLEVSSNNHNFVRLFKNNNCRIYSCGLGLARFYDAVPSTSQLKTHSLFFSASLTSSLAITHVQSHIPILAKEVTFQCCFCILL